MSEENIITKEVSAIVGALKHKKAKKKNKLSYFTGALIIMGLLLIVQTVQLSLLKAQISQGSFGSKAATTPAAISNDLPNMAGGC